MSDIEVEPNAEREYFSILEGILRTNPKKKLENVLQKITEQRSTTKGSSSTSSNANATASASGGGAGDKQDSPRTSSTGSGNQKQCKISQVIKCNQRVITQIQIARDNLLSAYMATTDLNSRSKSATDNISRSLSLTVGKLINLVSEASSLTQRIHENATGFHIAADFFRDPKDLSILNFSKSGRIPLSHFSCIEATSMCLTWIHSSAEKLAEEEATSTDYKIPPIRNNFNKIFKSFEGAMADLVESAELVSKIFRVLLYCNMKGKEMLQDYIKRLKPQEVNDLITEIQMMRRQFDDINISMDRLGWSLADIWGRCTGREIRFEDIRKEGFLKVKNFEEHELRKRNPGGSDKVAGMKTIKKRSKVSKAGMRKFLTKADSEDRMLKKSKGQLSLTMNKAIVTKPKIQKNPEKYSARLEKVLGKSSISSELPIIPTENLMTLKTSKNLQGGRGKNSLSETGKIANASLPPKGASGLKKNKTNLMKKIKSDEKKTITHSPRGTGFFG